MLSVSQVFNVCIGKCIQNRDPGTRLHTLLPKFTSADRRLHTPTTSYWFPCCVCRMSLFLGLHKCGSAGKESACNAKGLGWEDPLGKGKATHSSILAWRNGLYSLWGRKESNRTGLSDFHFSHESTPNCQSHSRQASALE